MSEYAIAINTLIKDPRKGSLMYYFKLFLLLIRPDEYWTQPQAVAFCNQRVADDGGVGWWSKNGPKKNPNGTIVMSFGDPGRTLEKFRREDSEGCWDNQTGNPEGPFRLNLDKFREFTGSTKNHTFSQGIRDEVLKRSGGKCELCGHKGRVEIDHAISKEKGGSSTLENANALCSRCNDRKCAKDLEQFMKEEFDRMFKYFKERNMDEQVKAYVIEKIM